MSSKTQALTEKLSRVARAQPVTVPRSLPLKDALLRMRERKTPCLLVCEGRRLVGIFTERDYLLKAAGRTRGDEPIDRFMTPQPISAGVDETVGKAVEVMAREGLRQLPVVDEDGAPASVVTVGGLIQHLAEDFPASVVNRPPEPHRGAPETDGA